MEENIMTIKDYAGVLKFAIKTQLDYIEEETEKACESGDYEGERYLNGVANGLRIALDKIDASMFLAK